MDKQLKYSIIAGIFIISFSLLWFVYEYSNSKSKNIRTFTVTGEGEEFFTPNIAELKIGVITKGNNLQDIQKQNVEKINKIIDYLKSLKIEDKDIKTENYLVNPEYDYAKPPYKIVGYILEQNISVKVRDLSKVAEVLANSVNYGANNVSGPNFTVDGEKIYLEKAREKAILDARQKAIKIAKTARFKLGKIVSISESSLSPPIPLRSYYMAQGEDQEILTPKTQPGQNSVKVTVSITYEIKY